MPFVNNFNPVDFIDKSVQATGTPDISAAFLDYFQGIVDAQGDGLATYSSDLEALESTVAGMGSAYTDAGFITGLKVQYTNATTLTISSGACYIPATGTIVSKSTDTTMNLTGLAANTLYYLYVANVSGALAFDVPSVTAPAAPYHGTARHKSGDTTRRYIGEFRTRSADTNAIPFVESRGLVRYRPTVAGWSTAPFELVSNKTSSTVTTIDASTVTPVGCTLMLLQGNNYNGEIGYFGDPATLTNTVWEARAEHGGSDTFEFHLSLNSSRQSGVKMAAGTSGGLYAGIVGYFRER